MPVVKDADGSDVRAFGNGGTNVPMSKDPPYELIFDCVDEPHAIGSRDDRGEQSTSELKRVVRFQFSEPASVYVLMAQLSELLLKWSAHSRTAKNPE